MKTIRISPLRHKGKTHIKIEFEYDKELIALVKMKIDDGAVRGAFVFG